jgi:hypothetical protein
MSYAQDEPKSNVVHRIAALVLDAITFGEDLGEIEMLHGEDRKQEVLKFTLETTKKICKLAGVEEYNGQSQKI